MVVLSLAVEDELVRDLHHPVGAALDVRRDEDIVRAGGVTRERVSGLQRLVPTCSKRGDSGGRAASTIEIARQRPYNAIQGGAHETSNRQRRHLSNERGCCVHRPHVEKTYGDGQCA